MAGSKKSEKQIKQKFRPEQRKVVQTEDPKAFYSEHPSWNFHTCDNEYWAFTQEAVGDMLWQEILPHLQELEKLEWQEIVLQAKKQNHSIEPNGLNKVARDRLDELNIEAESLISLRLNGTHRLYGFLVGSVFSILWFDQDYGDNKDCVCRSYLKHT